MLHASARNTNADLQSLSRDGPLKFIRLNYNEQKAVQTQTQE